MRQRDTSLTELARTLVVCAALLVFGGVVALPSVVTDFPFNILLMLLPLALALFVPRLHHQYPSLLAIFVEVASVWTGYAIAFHMYHGFWDGQGIAGGIVGLILSFPLVLFRIGRRHVRQAGGEAA